MTENQNPLSLLYPGSKTALMQHLQTLVLRNNRNWIGGVIAPDKFAGLAQKMAERYPILRSERGRIYDRSKGKTTAHMVAFPVPQGVAWWVLTDSGKGGLADPSSPDFKAAKDAMARQGHIAFEDYVMLYAHKKDARTLIDARTKREVELLKDCSTWTWRLSDEAFSEIVASIKAEAASLNYGDDGSRIYGLRGLLHLQRQRPLFAGVRTQVIQLHRIAIEEWGLVVKKWRAAHPQLVARYGSRSGELRSVKEITSRLLPKMTNRVRVFSDEKRTFQLLTQGVN